MKEKKYDANGFLLVSELQKCPYFEKHPSVRLCNHEDCFFCKYSDFRKQDYIDSVKTEARKGVLYSICHNRRNQRRIDQVGGG